MFKFVRKSRAVLEAEQTQTPLAIYEKIQSDDAEARQFELFDHFRTHRPRRYITNTIASGAVLYSAEIGAKSLIVLFGGKQHRPMVPPSVFLQMTDDEIFDVLLLKDQRHLHYDSGVLGWVDSIFDLASCLNRFVEKSGYHTVFCCGTSMGGLPALRVGRLIGAQRAISIGGRFAWHIDRLLKEGPAIGPFDALCSCVTANTPCVHIYAENDPVDPIHAEHLRKLLPNCSIVPLPFDHHNVVFSYFRAGLLHQFLAAIFDLRTDAEVFEAIPKPPSTGSASLLRAQ